MTRTKKRNLVLFLLTLVMCLSAVMVSTASADAATPKTSAEFAVSSAVEGKVVLTDMTPGIYMVQVKGSGTEKKGFGFLVEESQENYLTRSTDASFESTSAYINAFPAVLVEGTNTLVLYTEKETVTITDYKLTLVKAFPKAADATMIKYTFVKELNDDQGAAYNYIKVACGVTGHSGHEFHYYKATDGYTRSWAYKADGVAGTDYFTSLDELPDNCFIRDVSPKASEADGTADFGSSNSYGFSYTPSIGGKRGSLFFRATTTIKMTVNATTAGTYDLYSVFAANNTSPAISITVNGTAIVTDKAPTWTEVDEIFTPGSAYSAGMYGSLATVTLKAGKNVIVMDSAAGWVTMPGISLVHEHALTYEKDATQHWGKCACGFESAKENHNAPADDGDCTTAVICPTCEYVVTAAKEHTGGTATCTAKAVCTNAGCGKAYGDTLPHTGGTATCTAMAKCTVCQNEYGNLEPHVFTEKKYDEAQHWNKCANCDAVDWKEDHEGGTASCTAKAVCETCRQPYGDLLAHEFTAYKTLEDGHVKKCANCDATDDATKAAHEYGEDKKCVCGAEKTGCGASIAASAIAVTAVLGLGIGFIRKKKED